MTLRRKTLIIICVSVFSGVALMYAAGRLILLERFGQLERIEATRDVERVVGALDRDIEQLSLFASDYAAWDDTYDFIETRAPEYSGSNLTFTTFVDNRVNSILYFNRFGEPVAHYSRDLETALQVDTPEALLEILETHPSLGSHSTTMDHHSGLLWIDGQLYMISSQPIVTSDREGPIRGSLMMVRLMDEEEKARLAETTLLDVSLNPVLGSFQGDSWRQVLLSVVDRNRIDGSVIIPDALGAPVAEIVARLPRPVMQEGRRAVLYLLIAVLIIGLGLGGMMIALLESVVIGRMSELSEKVQSIGTASKTGERIGVSGRDEVSQLAATINGTLEALELSQDALRYVGRNARCLLWTAEARQSGAGTVDFRFSIQDEEAAQRVFPLALAAGASYAETWRRSIPEEDRVRLRERAQQALQSDEGSYSVEYRVRLADGSERWIAEEVDVQRRGPDRWRLAGVGTDVTTRREAAEEVQRARDAALDVARLKSDFLANMSHEIRTPMNGILGMTQLLMESDLSEEQREQLGMVRSSAETLLRVINDILDFSKIEAGRMEVAEGVFCLRRTLDDALALLSLQAQTKGLVLTVDVAPDVPERVLGDPVRLTQVISNLTSNGIKFTDSGEVRIDVSLQKQRGDRMEILTRVRDTGLGIEPDKQEVIFESFRQADTSTTRRFGGTGLGLAICQRLVELMGGSIWLESMPGQGSTFLFTVEVRSCEEDVPDAPPSGSAMVIDSCAATVEAIAHRLERYGVRTVDEAASDEPVHFALVSAARSEDETTAAVERARARLTSDGEVRLLTHELARAEAERVSARLVLRRPLIKPVREREIARLVERVFGVRFDDEWGAGADVEEAQVEALGPMRVLVAEDNKVNQRVTQRLLEKAGHRVEIVEDGAVAVEQALTGDFDVGLFDIQMPVMGGEEAARRIRAAEGDGRHLPLIALTAHAMRGDKERFLASGMDGYVTKPVEASALYAEMARVLSGTESVIESHEAALEDRIDLDAVASRLGGDRELALEALSLFREDCSKRMQEIDSALATGVWSEVSRTAHGLRGALGQIASVRGAQAAARLERCSDEEDAEGCRGAIAELKSEIAALLAQIDGIGENGHS